MPALGVLGAFPSCLRGSWGCGASLGTILCVFLMSYGRTPHPQVAVEALAVFRRQDSHRIHRWEAPLETETGSSKTRISSKNSDCCPRPQPRAASPSQQRPIRCESCLRKAARASTTTCGCGVRLHDIKNMIVMDPSDAQHRQEPRRHDGRAPSAPRASTAG